MIKQKEQIKKLIQHGFDLELISFELGIPIEEIKECKKELEKNDEIVDAKKKERKGNRELRKNDTESRKKDGKQGYEKLREMRGRYKSLFTSSKVEKIESKFVSEEDKKIVDGIILKIEESISLLPKSSRGEKREKVMEIVSRFKILEKYTLSIEQAEKLYYLMNHNELDILGRDVDKSVVTLKKATDKHLLKAINTKLNENITKEELIELQKKITLEMRKRNELSVSAVQSCISRKIQQMDQNEAIERIKNNISVLIMSVITDLANGELDIKKANEIIEEEAKKRVESKKGNRFTLTIEQEKKQILMQMRTAIRDKGNEYPIKNPEKAIVEMTELFGGELEVTMNSVVENLISQKKYDEANAICEKIFKENKGNESIKRYCWTLQNKVRNVQISNFILAGIHLEASPEEESAYFELIEKGLKQANISLNVISLGKDEDGIREIRLADVWPVERIKEKSRE